MMKKIEDLNYYELLEVSQTATSQEIHKAYERVRRIYDPNSIALYSLFSDDETAVIHQRIEDAYRTLMYETKRKQYDTQLRGGERMPERPAPEPMQLSMPKYETPVLQPKLPLQSENRYLRNDGPPSSHTALEKSSPGQETLSPVSPFIAEFTGSALKVLREQHNLSLAQIAEMTKISARYLELIEDENYAKLPARPYLRGFLVLYAKVLGYDTERVSGDYLKRYDAATGKRKS